MNSYTDRDIHREIAGRELEILQALGIHPQGRGHQHCPFPDHADRRPSWRWDGGKRRWFCSCGSGTVIDAVMRAEGLDAAGAIRWIRSTVLGDDEAPRPRRRPAPSPANSNAEQHRKRRLQEEVAARALRFWREADPASPNHPYLRAKGVRPHELRERNGVLYVALFDITGRIWTLQTISQDADGGFAKRFLRGGRAAGLFAPVGLNAPPRRVIVCEGVATAATLRERTGWPVMAAMNAGNLMAIAKTARETWPEADIVLAADNDRRTRGNPGVTKATEAALAVGARLAIPQFPDDAGDKDTDFNDLQRLAPGAVAAAIEAAELPAPPPPPAEPARRAFLSAEAASEALTAAVDEFFAAALRPPPLDVPGAIDLSDHAPFHAIRAAAGLGKSEAVLKRLTDPALAGKHIVYAVPTVELAHELKARYDAMAKPGNSRMLAILGRDQNRPDGVRMCRKHRAAEAVAKLGINVQTTLCKRQLKGKEAERHGSTVELCPHFHECPYQRQIEDRDPAIRVMPHARLFLPGRKDEERSPDLVVIDEAFHNAALRGTLKLHAEDAGGEGRSGYFVVLDRLAGEGRGIMNVPRRDGAGEDHDATDHLDKIGARCARALYAGGRLSDFAAQGVSEEDAAAAMNLAYRCIDPLHVTPAMPEAIQRERIKVYQGQEALRLGRFFKLIKQALAAGIDSRCFELRRNVPNGDGRLEDRCYMRWSEDLKIADAAVLLIDADLDEQVARRFVPRLAKVTEIEAQPVHYTATQITDRRVSMDMMCPSFRVRAAIAETDRIPAEIDAKDRTRINNCKRLHRLAEVKAASGRRGLVVSYKAVAEILRVLPPIEGVEFAHFSALRGVDRWKNVDFVIVAGSPQVNEGDLERTAEALWLLSPEPIRKIEPDGRGERAYGKEPRRIEMADGSSTTIVSVDSHPDDRCARLLNLIRREVDQAIGRARLIHRQPGSPCEVLLLTNVPTGLPIHKTTTWREATDVNPVDLLMARGILPERLRDIAKVLPELVESDADDPRRAVHNALAATGLSPDELSTFPYRKLSIGKRGQLVRFRYRLKGDRQSACARIDVVKHGDPRVAVQAIFGELERFEAVTSTSGGEAIDTAGAAPVAMSDPAPPTTPIEPAHPLPEPMPAAEPELSTFIGFGHEDLDFNEWCSWPGPRPEEMRRQAALPRLLISNLPPEPPEGPEKLSDTELIRLLPPKQPTDTAVGWECRCHDVLRAWKIDWFRAQKLVREQSAAYDWRKPCLLPLASIRDSP